MNRGGTRAGRARRRGKSATGPAPSVLQSPTTSARLPLSPMVSFAANMAFMLVE